MKINQNVSGSDIHSDFAWKHSKTLICDLNYEIYDLLILQTLHFVTLNPFVFSSY